jgi:hypothetical protein
MTPLIRWLRRWQQRDDRHLVKRAASEAADPIEELLQIVGEAQDRDAVDERRLYPTFPASYPRSRSGHR